MSSNPVRLPAAYNMNLKYLFVVRAQRGDRFAFDNKPADDPGMRVCQERDRDKAGGDEGQ
jgi:hypothetical protein